MVPSLSDTVIVPVPTPEVATSMREVVSPTPPMVIPSLASMVISPALSMLPPSVTERKRLRYMVTVSPSILPVLLKLLSDQSNSPGKYFVPATCSRPAALMMPLLVGSSVISGVCGPSVISDTSPVLLTMFPAFTIVGEFKIILLAAPIEPIESFSIPAP